MTPKEKAIELIKKFMPLYEGISLGFAKKLWAEKSALIAVDEILEMERLIANYNDAKKHNEYWQEVKQEIENYILIQFNALERKY